MRVAISNIAWDVSEDEHVAKLLQRYNVDAIDIAPGKYFPEPAKATDAEIAQVKRWWADKGIQMTGMQALLFGTTGLNVFGAPTVQEALLNHLNAICRIGSGLGATRLVFGSPKNRDRTGLTDEQANRMAIDFFRRLGNIAEPYGVSICLEPNPASYGCNFMTTSVETARMVELVNHSAIRMQLDSGAITINGEDPTEVLSACARFIGHIHASEPNLVPLGDGGTDHAKVSVALATKFSEHLVCVEMVATKSEPHLVAIERALQVAIRHYRDFANGEEASV